MENDNFEYSSDSQYKDGLFLGLSIPPIFIPDTFLGNLRLFSQLVYSTRKPDPSIYDLEHYSLEALQAPVDDYLMFGLAGHGVHSWAFHYYLSYKPLHIFAQLQWGSKNTDEVLVHSRFEGLFSGLELLLEARQSGAFPKEKRLIIIESDFCGSSHGWVQGHPKSFKDCRFEPSAEHLSLMNALLSVTTQSLVF